MTNTVADTTNAINRPLACRRALILPLASSQTHPVLLRSIQSVHLPAITAMLHCGKHTHANVVLEHFVRAHDPVPRNA